MTVVSTRSAGSRRAPTATSPDLLRWAPLASVLVVCAGILLAAGTSPLDLVRYVGYAFLAVILPGTLLYRALRRTPHALVEDLAMGTAVGLVLELVAWAVMAPLHLQSWLWLWPLAVIVPFAAVPRLRRHWWVRDYAARPPIGWSWAVAGVVAFFTYYLSQVFLDRNPILPTSDGTNQYLDLAYQLSLAGEAKHQFPIHLPQVADEPLHYHWFGYVHMAATSLVGHIDLPVVALRLAIPALCAAAIVLTAVVGWRLSGRPYVGAGAAVLFFVIGEVNFTHFVTQPFGTQAAFVIWHGMSMIYSWVLLIALIAPLASLAGAKRTPPMGGVGAFVLATLLLFASSGAKASSVPVVAVALAFTAVALLATQRKIPWKVVGIGLVAGLAQLFALAVLFDFNSYGVRYGPLGGLKVYVPDGTGWAMIALVAVVFLVNMQSRVAGVIPLVWLKKGRLDPAQWLLLGGAIAGPGLYLVFDQPSGGNQYFTRAGFAFGVLLSAWGFALVLERARLTDHGKGALAAFAAAFAGLLVAVQLRYATSPPSGNAFAELRPILIWIIALTIVGIVLMIGWFLVRLAVPALRGRGAIVLLTGILVAGAPGLIMDIHKGLEVPNGGAYALVNMPKSRVDAARFVRDHSSPRDVVATNVHCKIVYEGDVCDSRSFWLSAYSERRVLVEGWGFAPRMANLSYPAFWDQALVAKNDAAISAPTRASLDDLRATNHVRFLVVDRTVSEESPALATLTKRVFDNGRMAVYELS